MKTSAIITFSEVWNIVSLGLLSLEVLYDCMVTNSLNVSCYFQYERQQMQEQAFELTQRIDTQLGEIRSLLLKRVS